MINYKNSIIKDGFVFTINKDKTATAEFYYDFEGEEAIVPSEINGIPVTAFRFSLGTSWMMNVIKSIMLPACVKNIFNDHLSYFNTRIVIDENNPYLFSDGKAVYSKDLSELKAFTAHSDEEYTILDGCRTISEKAFYMAYNLKRINFPEELETIGENAFRECTELTELNLPSGLVTLGSNAFYSSRKIEKITLPPTLEYIGDHVFAKGLSAASIELPPSLKHIGIEAFPRFWTLKLSEENPYFTSRDGLILSSDGKTVVCPAQPPENGILVIPDGISEIGQYAFSSNNSIEKVILPKGLHTIGKYAFSHAKRLKEIDLENVRELGEGAFEFCTSLEKISLKCCSTIGKRAFFSCSHLTEAEVDCEITGVEMFKECKKLRRVVLKNTKIISASTFFVASELKEAVLPEGLEVIGEAAFSRVRFKTLTIPKTVRRIGKNIADYMREIHIYDNIETDISLDNDISDHSYTLYVHSAKTDEIIYAVPVIGSRGRSTRNVNDHKKIVRMFRGGVSFDFKEFDSHYSEISDEKYNNMYEKFDAALTRLKYDYELDERSRRNYEELVSRLGCAIAASRMKNDRIKKALDPVLYRYMSLKDLTSLVDLSTELRLTELTAILMQKCNEKRSTSQELKANNNTKG